jgi:hypothetical protein
MIPHSFKLILSPALDVEDGKTSLTLGVGAKVHLAAVALLHDHYVRAVSELLAQQGCAPSVAATHLQVLKANDSAQLRSFWLELRKLMVARR